MMRNFLFLVAVLSAAIHPANAFEPSAYLCRPDSVAGFRYNDSDGKWYSSSFSAPEKYMLRPLELDGQDKAIKASVETEKFQPTWGLFEFKVSPREPSDGGSLKSLCKKDESKFSIGKLICKTWLLSVEFNENTSKFIAYYEGNYLFNPPAGEKPDNPVLIVGHCEPYTDYQSRDSTNTTK
jgi:hypothetical protein